MLIGYARVSTQEQDRTLQQDTLQSMSSEPLEKSSTNFKRR
jgi:DNA invertase Pin-like site-specific DNA recombinase